MTSEDPVNTIVSSANNAVVVLSDHPLLSSEGTESVGVSSALVNEEVREISVVEQRGLSVVNLGLGVEDCLFFFRVELDSKEGIVKSLH